MAEQADELAPGVPGGAQHGDVARGWARIA